MEEQYNDLINISIDDMCLDDYLTIIEILSLDEYEQYEDILSKKMVNRKTPIEKSKRSDKFMLELYRKVVRRLSNAPKKLLKDDTFIMLIMSQLEPLFKELSEMVNGVGDDYDLTKTVYNFNGSNIYFNNISEWEFNKWITLEHWLSNGLKELDENGESIVRVKGNRYMLPIVFGDYDSMLEDKLKFFLYDLPIKETIKSYICIMNMINKVRESHIYIYNNNSSGESKSPNMSLHCKTFGWLETLRELSEKRIFGTYIETKKAPLFEVLEYLNISCSRDSAETMDWNLKNNKK